MIIFQCNPTYKHTERKKLHDLLIRCQKAIDKNPKPLHIKVCGEIRDKRNISKHDFKKNLQQANNQHKIKWRRNQSDSTKIRNKKGCPSFQYSTLSSSLGNKTAKGDQDKTRKN